MAKNRKFIIYTVAGMVIFLTVFSVWITSALSNFLPFFLTTDGWNKNERVLNKKNDDSNKPILTETEARYIAEKSCIKGGDALSVGSYNQITKTWWFDANLNASREGCNPACVVNQETKTAEINWRCTGLIPPVQTNQDITPASGQCGIENCHGLDIVCGPNPAEICTEIYRFGDKCRQFAECGVVNNTCKQIDNPRFTACKTCAIQCEQDFPGNPEKAFECESKCE